MLMLMSEKKAKRPWRRRGLALEAVQTVSQHVIEPWPLTVREQTFEEKWTEAFQRVVAQRGPKFSYIPFRAANGAEYCRYVHNDEGEGCLVGQILVKMGVPVEHLRTHEGQSADRIIHHLFGYAPGVEKVAAVMRNIQVAQDCRSPWGLCLSMYRDYMKHL
jgi:hypothetical protein